MKNLSKKSVLIMSVLMLLTCSVLPATAGHNQGATPVSTIQEKPNTPGTDGPVNPFE